MTLIEIMIVLVLVGALMFAMAVGLGGKASSELRERSIEFMGLLRMSSARAVSTGTHHRLSINLEDQSYKLEACEGKIRLRSSDEAEEAPDDEELEELRDTQSASESTREMLEAESPENALKAAAALKGVDVGSSQCQAAEATGAGTPSSRTIKSETGLKIESVWVQHVREPVTEGSVSINFFPLGYAEKAVIRFQNSDKESRQVLVHGLTGKIEIVSGDFDPDDHMRRDARGEEVEARE